MANIPEATDAAIDDSENDETQTIRERLVDAVGAQGDVEGYSEHVLSAVK